MIARLHAHEGKYCSCYQLEHDIIEYVFHISSNASVDEMIGHYNLFKELYQQIIREGGVVRLLYDTRESGPMPMYYNFQQTSKWQQTQGSQRPRLTQCAFLSRPSAKFYDKLLDGLTRTVLRGTNTEYRFFEADRDAAIAWLLGES